MKTKVPKPKKFQQNTEVKDHFHPRWLARAIIHNQLRMADASGVNKVTPGAGKSPFARKWRDEAVAMFGK